VPIRRLALLLLAVAACGSTGDDTTADDDLAPDVDAAVDEPDAGAGAATVTIATWAVLGDRGLLPEPVAWIAVQDGDGPFAPISGDGGYRFDVTDPDGRYGIAIACAGQAAGGLQVVQATLAEADHVDLVCHPTPTTGVHDFELAIANPGPCSGLVSYPNTQYQINCNGPLGVSTALDGWHDVIGRATFGADRRVYLARDVAGDAFTVDFSDPALSRAGVPATLTAGDTGVTFVGFRTASSYHTIVFNQGSTTWFGFPADLRRPLDIHQVSVFTATTMTHVLTRAPVDVDLSAVPELIAPDAAVTRQGATWQPFAGAGLSIRVGAWRHSVSAGWLAGATSYAYPPVCEVAGFPGGCPADDDATEWTVTGYQVLSEAALPQVLAAEGAPNLAIDGLRYQLAADAGTITP
jgi:hypothetical protein